MVGTGMCIRFGYGVDVGLLVHDRLLTTFQTCKVLLGALGMMCASVAFAGSYQLRPQSAGFKNPSGGQIDFGPNMVPYSSNLLQYGGSQSHQEGPTPRRG